MSLANYQVQSPPEVKRSSEIPDIGVALFDDPQAPSSGWCSVGGQDSTRFSGFADLRNNALWITNLEFSAYSVHAKTFSNVRRTDFLRNPLTKVAYDLGFQAAGAHSQEASQKLSGIGSRVIGMAAHCYGISSMASVLRSNTLYEDLRGILPRAPAVSEAMFNVVEGAYQSSSSVNIQSSYLSDAIYVSLQRNRLHHALDVMNTPIPDEAWVKSGPQPMSFWLDESRACIVEATVELSATDPDVAALIAFGSTPGVGAGKKGMLRAHISQPELRWLVKYAKVHVVGGYVCSSRPIPKDVFLPGALTADPLFALSYSAGLLAEMHWNAYASQAWARSTGPSGMPGKTTNTWGVWFRALDRAISFEMALEAHKAGYLVRTYGNGSVRIRIPRNSLREAEQFASHIGASHPSFETILHQNGIDQ